MLSAKDYAVLMLLKRADGALPTRRDELDALLNRQLNALDRLRVGRRTRRKRAPYSLS